MGNGCVRVYSGLMDQMNDDELRGVIGHEMGHVALGHSKKAMQTAYAVSAARTAAGAASPGVAALTKPRSSATSPKFINAQFSQTQESAADDYSFDLMKQKGMNQKGLVTAFQKLAARRRQEPMMDSHRRRRAARSTSRIASRRAADRATGRLPRRAIKRRHENPTLFRAWGFCFWAGAAYGTIPGSTYACASVINPTITANSRLCRTVKRNSSDSLPTRPVAAQATAIDCGEIIFAVTPPVVFAATASVSGTPS